ncbi:MAG TPA: hypothetical protein VM282_25575 [Acidimicrobiales bacterium]|nr:hypothetical protein [Acidimicrobiales bacterium]
MRAFGDHQRGGGVAQIVEPRARVDVGAFDCGAEVSAVEADVAQRSACGRGEHECRRVLRPGAQMFVEFARACRRIGSCWS